MICGVKMKIKIPKHQGNDAWNSFHSAVMDFSLWFIFTKTVNQNFVHFIQMSVKFLIYKWWHQLFHGLFCSYHSITTIMLNNVFEYIWQDSYQMNIKIYFILNSFVECISNYIRHYVKQIFNYIWNSIPPYCLPLYWLENSV